MNRKILIAAIALSSAASLLLAQDGQRPPRPGGGPGAGAPRLHLLPRGAEEALNLTGEQQKRLSELEAEVKTKVESILTPEQVEKLKGLRPPPGGPGNRGPQTGGPEGKRAVTMITVATASRPAPEEPAPASLKPLPPGVVRLPVVFSGGHDTLPVDHGRPVVLIAAALGVKDEVFREAFSHVHPAGPGRGGPTDSEARANKAALMNALEKLGVTNDRLNTVSNFYRYASWEGGIWKNKPATANALVKDGAVVGYEITSAGYGYTTPPTVSAPGLNGPMPNVKLSFGKDMESNGAIAEITISQAN